MHWHLEVHSLPAFKQTQYFFLQLPLGHVQWMCTLSTMLIELNTFIEPLFGSKFWTFVRKFSSGMCWVWETSALILVSEIIRLTTLLRFLRDWRCSFVMVGRWMISLVWVSTAVSFGLIFLDWLMGNDCYCISSSFLGRDFSSIFLYGMNWGFSSWGLDWDKELGRLRFYPESRPRARLRDLVLLTSDLINCFEEALF